MKGVTDLQVELRELLNGFWNEALEIEPLPKGVAFTMPMSYPDGWQVTMELCCKTPVQYYLSDRGKTLSWLLGQGQSVGIDAVKDHLSRLYAEHAIEEVDGVLYRWLQAPLDPIDLQVFAEGLVAVSRLDILNEHRMAEENVAEKTVNRVFEDAQLTPKCHHKLNITYDRGVFVDYFVNLAKPVAIELIRNKNDLPGTMEKWGYRWRELRKSYAGLTPVMLYDRNTQIIDSYSARIGRNDCDLFCGYDETDRIHQVLGSAR
ncbi:MAG: hypothetical protein OXD47_10460 [Gammaproteobacteria bacterium]|nr:hypothetical protein [Gammaproteobacteria bacterium]MCY4339202.1 hypothetical protein [Gammaproteobacteria bacterium]